MPLTPSPHPLLLFPLRSSRSCASLDGLDAERLLTQHTKVIARGRIRKGLFRVGDFIRILPRGLPKTSPGSLTDLWKRRCREECVRGQFCGLRLRVALGLQPFTLNKCRGTCRLYKTLQPYHLFVEARFLVCYARSGALWVLRQIGLKGGQSLLLLS